MNVPKPFQAIQDNIARVIKGKAHVIEMAVVCLLARGHLLLEDVPGVGKTTLAHSLARSLDCSFKRIQFTSDLLPSDIVGVSIFNRQQQAFEFVPGPIFANIVLADEINRTTPKTQSSLLEAMSEAQISVDNQTHPLKQPFMVIATQNPAEYHGTFPLPESQLDRFLMRLRIGYPSLEEERKVLNRPYALHPADGLAPVLTAQDVLELQRRIEVVHMDDSVSEYLLALVHATRQSELLVSGREHEGGIGTTQRGEGPGARARPRLLPARRCQRIGTNCIVSSCDAEPSARHACPELRAGRAHCSGHCRNHSRPRVMLQDRHACDEFIRAHSGRPHPIPAALSGNPPLTPPNL